MKFNALVNVNMNRVKRTYMFTIQFISFSEETEEPHVILCPVVVLIILFRAQSQINT